MRATHYRIAIGLLIACFVAACKKEALDPPPPVKYRFDESNYKNIQFKDDVETNAEGKGLLAAGFFDAKGKQVRIRDLVGKENLVVVITRGYPGDICIYCSTQVSRIVAKHEEFTKRGAKVVVVFPLLKKDGKVPIQKFVESVVAKIDPKPESIPFPILLDPERSTVDSLGLRKDLAKPSTFILDAKGNVRFAYVGRDIEDRPSWKAILRQLDEMAGKKSKKNVGFQPPSKDNGTG